MEVILLVLLFIFVVVLSTFLIPMHGAAIIINLIIGLGYWSLYELVRAWDWMHLPAVALIFGPIGVTIIAGYLVGALLLKLLRMVGVPIPGR